MAFAGGPYNNYVLQATCAWGSSCAKDAVGTGSCSSTSMVGARSVVQTEDTPN